VPTTGVGPARVVSALPLSPCGEGRALAEAVALQAADLRPNDLSVRLFIWPYAEIAGRLGCLRDGFGTEQQVGVEKSMDDLSNSHSGASCLGRMLGAATMVILLGFWLYSCVSQQGFSNVEELANFCTSNVVDDARSFAQEQGIDFDTVVNTNVTHDAMVSDVETCMTQSGSNVQCVDRRPKLSLVICSFKETGDKFHNIVELHDLLAKELAKSS